MPVFAGNWKMYKGPAAARLFLERFIALSPERRDATVVFFPPAISIPAAADVLNPRPDILLGIQNVHEEKEGAFTGEISASMALEAGATFALTGHSERRHGMGESDERVAAKTVAALDAGLRPVVCVGETLEEREAARLEEVLSRQLGAVLDRLDDERAARLLLAYEPVWAIGTGRNATPDDAAAAHAFLRGLLARRLNDERANRMPILYGGSVKPDNASALLAAPGVDGVLVGGASLDPDGFAKIVAVDTDGA